MRLKLSNIHETIRSIGFIFVLPWALPYTAFYCLHEGITKHDHLGIAIGCVLAVGTVMIWLILAAGIVSLFTRKTVKFWGIEANLRGIRPQNRAD